MPTLEYPRRQTSLVAAQSFGRRVNDLVSITADRMILQGATTARQPVRDAALEAQAKAGLEDWKRLYESAIQVPSVVLRGILADRAKVRQFLAMVKFLLAKGKGFFIWLQSVKGSCEMVDDALINKVAISIRRLSDMAMALEGRDMVLGADQIEANGAGE